MSPASDSDAKADHWRTIAARWSQVGSPLRPCREDVGLIAEEARAWTREHGRPPRVLILGVTPELCQLPWPEGTVIRALDRSADMIGAVWPGDSAAATCGDWLSMDASFAAGSFDFVCCDGGLGLLSHPYGQRRFLRQIAGVLAPSGLVVLRLFLPPSRPESPEAVLRDVRAGHVTNMNELKLRLLHAMTPDLVTGVRLGDVYDRLTKAEPDFAALAVRIGCSLAQVSAIESYRGSRDRYHLVGLDEAEASLGLAGMRVVRRHVPGYADGESFPTLVCAPSKERPEPVSASSSEDQARLAELIEGHRGTAIAYAAVRLGLPASLAGAPRDATTLAAELGVSAEPLRRLLRGMVLAGLASESVEGCFALAATGRGLLPGRPGANHAFLAGEEFAAAWGGLVQAVSSGGPAFDHVFGQDVWSHRRSSSELDSAYAEWMSSDSSRVAEQIAEAADFGRHRLIADVGGGRGALLSAILRRHPVCRGLLFEQPSVARVAARFFTEAGLTERCEVCSGDFRVDFPFTADAFVLLSVLHNWADPDAVRLLDRCRRSLVAAGRIYLVERVAPAKVADDPYVVGLDLHMLAVTGGRERTVSELTALLAEAGLGVRDVRALPSGLRLYETAP